MSDLPEASRAVISSALGLAREGKASSSSDLARVDSTLEECLRGAYEVLSLAQDTDSPLTADWTDVGTQYTDELRAISGGIEAVTDLNQRERSIGEVDQLVFRLPGRFIHLIYEELNPTGMRKGFSYGSVRDYVDELVSRGRVLTVGGPQGIPRYCFPHPNQLQSRSKYYGGPFGIPGVIEEDVTNDFDFSRARGSMPEVFLTNQILNSPILLLARGGNLGGVTGRRTKSYGRIFPFEEMERFFGLRAKNGIQPRDILLAGKVILDEGPGNENVLWSDPALENLFPSHSRRLE